MRKTADKWDLKRNVQFNTRVIALDWVEQLGRWKVRVRRNGQEMDELVDVLVSAQGFLR